MNATVDLACAQHPIGLIVLAPTGVHYSNQVAGTCCSHPSAEGLFVPLEDEDDWTSELFKHTGDYSFGDIPEENIAAIDRVLADYGLPLAVDRSRWGDSAEAWLYVMITGDRTFDTVKASPSWAHRTRWLDSTDWTGLTGRTAVLTWQNSD